METNSLQDIKKIKLKLLIDGCLKNDESSQYEFYKTYYSLMKSITMRYAASTDEAEDMLNEGFLKIFQNLQTYDFTGSFTAWMKTVMTHTAIDYVRKYKSYTSYVDMDSISEYQIESYHHNEAVAKMNLDDLLVLIQKLPPMSRMVFNLYIMEGYSHKEIAKMLNIKEGTSHWHLNYAKNTLKENIKKMTYDSKF